MKEGGWQVASCTSSGGNLEAALRRPFHSHLSKSHPPLFAAFLYDKIIQLKPFWQ